MLVAPSIQPLATPMGIPGEARERRCDIARALFIVLALGALLAHTWKDTPTSSYLTPVLHLILYVIWRKSINSLHGEVTKAIILAGKLVK